MLLATEVLVADTKLSVLIGGGEGAGPGVAAALLMKMASLKLSVGALPLQPVAAR